MTRRQAEKLHNEDEMMVKETGEILTVLSVDVYNKMVLVHCDNGNAYHHKDIRWQKVSTRSRQRKLLPGYFFVQITACREHILLLYQKNK